MNIVIPILAYRNPVFLITRLAVDIYYNVRYYVLMLLFVTISVSISIFLTIAVFAILAVFPITIVVSIFALIHINTIDQGTEVWQLVFTFQVIDQFIVALMGIISAADITLRSATRAISWVSVTMPIGAVSSRT